MNAVKPRSPIDLVVQYWPAVGYVLIDLSAGTYALSVPELSLIQNLTAR